MDKKVSTTVCLPPEVKKNLERLKDRGEIDSISKAIRDLVIKKYGNMQLKDERQTLLTDGF